MSEIEINIEQIVAAVVERLSVTNGFRAQSGLGIGVEAAEHVESGTVFFHGSLVTLARLENRWRQCRRLVVDRRAVITPAVRDELQKRGVELAFQESIVEQRQSKSTSLPCCVGVAVNDHERDHFVSLLSGLDADVEQVSCVDSDEAVCEATTAVRGERRSIIWTARPAEAMCLANRHPNIWAIQASDVNSLVDAQREVSGNLLVVDRRHDSQAMQRSLIKAFLRPNLKLRKANQ